MELQHIDKWEERIPGGCHWSGLVRRGTTLRLTDLEGGANAAVLFYNQDERLERYNMADTLKSQHTFRLTKRSEEHTSELQSLTNLVCRLLLEKKNNLHTLT